MDLRMSSAKAVSVAAFVAALLAGAGTAPAAPAAVLTIDLAKLGAEQLAAGAWAEPAKVDDHACRVAAGGKTAWLQAPAWWKDGLRPAEGQYFLVEVNYKDTASHPIVLSVWGGLGFWGEAGSGHTELHRFGGLNDGKWKTVQVPLGWDLVMVRPGTRSVEFSIESKEGEVPVASIRVLPLAGKDVAGAAERWNAETRATVRQVQKQYEGKERKEFDKAQKPAEQAAKAGPVVPYARTYLSTIYPYSAPQAAELGVPLKARMARNEYEPAAFGVYANGKDLTNVTVKVEPLRHASDAKAVLPAEVRTAEYALARNGSGIGISPMRLWPMYATQIAKGQSGWFWVTFHSDPKTTPAGLYRSKVTISSDQGQASLEVQVQVVPITLAEMNETDLRMGGCITGMVSRHDMEEMLRHNHNQLQYWFSGVRPKFVVKPDGDFDLDFAVLDDQFEQARKAGIQSNVYFLGGNPYGFPSTQTLPRELARQVLGMTMDQYKESDAEGPVQRPGATGAAVQEVGRQGAAAREGEEVARADHDALRRAGQVGPEA